MTKIAKIENVCFGEKNLGAKARKHTTISNEGTESIVSPSISINNDVFSLDTFSTTLMPKLPINSTIYLDANGFIQNASGEFYTTNQGYGTFCTTDGLGVPTIAFGIPDISITSPLSGNFELETNQTLNWTSSDVALVDITITGTLGGSKVYSGITASLGTYTFQLNSADGFVVNDTFEIEVSACVGATSDTVTGLGTIATIVIDTIGAQVAGVAFDVEGDSNGAEVEIFHMLASGGSWVSDGTATVTAGRYTKSVTISGAETYDIKVEDTTDSDGNAQQDNVVVASGQAMFAQFSGNDGDTIIHDSTEDTDNFYIVGETEATQLEGNVTGYTATPMSFCMSVAKDTLEIGWINFYEGITGRSGIGIDGDWLYFSCNSSGTDIDIVRLKKDNSSTSTLTKSTGSAINFMGLIILDNVGFVYGFKSPYLGAGMDFTLDSSMSGTARTLANRQIPYPAFAVGSVGYFNAIIKDAPNNTAVSSWEFDPWAGTIIDESGAVYNGNVPCYNTDPSATRAVINYIDASDSYKQKLCIIEISSLDIKDTETLGTLDASANCSDVRYIDGKFYALVADSTNAKWTMRVFDDADVYNETDTYDIAPYSGGAYLGYYNGFRSLSNNDIVLISGLTGKIDVSSTTSGYKDIVFKVVAK